VVILPVIISLPSRTKSLPAIPSPQPPEIPERVVMSKGVSYMWALILSAVLCLPLRSLLSFAKEGNVSDTQAVSSDVSRIFYLLNVFRLFCTRWALYILRKAKYEIWKL